METPAGAHGGARCTLHNSHVACPRPAASPRPPLLLTPRSTFQQVSDMSGHTRAHDNPFDDPSVQSAVRGGGDHDDLESNPFETSSLKEGGSIYSAPVDVDDDPETELYPTSTRGTAPAHTMRMDDLQRRERELEERERELDARTEHMRKFGRNNWPPFYPIMYHDIESEIPPDSQPVMLNVYRLWLLLVATLLWNMATCIVLMVSMSGRVSDMVNSVVYVVVITGCSFMLWYRPLYNGLMKEHSFFFYVYFLFCGFHILFSLYAVIGAQGTGCAGFFTMINTFRNSHVVGGVLSAVATTGFLLQGLGQAWYYHVVWVHNSERGHTFAQAKAELASHGLCAYLSRGSRV